MVKKTKVDIDKKCIDMVESCVDESIKFYTNVKKQWNTFEYLYVKGAAKRNTPRGRANLELPLAFQQIEPFVDHLSELMFNEAPYIPYRGRTEDDMQFEEDITNFVQWQLEEGQFYSEWNPFCRNLGKLGTAIMKIVWEEDVIERQVEASDIGLPSDTPEDLLDELKQFLPETQSEVLFDGPRFYNLSPWEVHIPPGASNCDIQKMPWVAHEVWRSIDELIANPNYELGQSKLKKLRDKDIEEDKDYIKGSEKKTKDEDKSKESAIALYGSNANDKHSGKIKVIEWWGDYRFNPKEAKKPALIGLAFPGCEEPILLRREENPFKYKFKPFVMAYDYKIDGEPYGYGELNHIKSLISEQTALRNARLDRTNMSLNSMWLVERHAGINLRELYSAPDKIILCDNKEGITRFDTSGANQASVEEIAQLGFDIQNTTEILDPKQDVSRVGSAFGRTATGINYLQSRSQMRLVIKAKILQYTFIRPLARMLLWYNKEFISDAVHYRVNGKEVNPFSTLPEDAFLADVDYIPETTPIRATMSERKENLSYQLQVAAQIEGVTPGVNNFTEVLKEAWKLTGFAHPERFVNDIKKQTMVIDDGQGNLLDEKGQPVQIVPIEQLQQGSKGGSGTGQGGMGL